MKSIRAVLFDLDGTLVDTAPDLLGVINQLRKEHHLSPLDLASFRAIVSFGSKKMIKQAFAMDEDHPKFDYLRQRFFNLYQQHLADATQLFPTMDQVLTFLEENNIPWGIVTNKLTRHTTALLKALRLDHRPSCVVCGDSLPKYKPDPEPILHACKLIKHPPNSCVYMGDSQTDVIASKAAGTTTLVALYGYLSQEDNPLAWQADGYINAPLEILDWLKNKG